MLRIAADLQDPLAQLGESSREVRGGGALADAALAIDGDHQGALFDRHRVILMDLNTALPILAESAGVEGGLEGGGHGGAWKGLGTSLYPRTAG